MKKDKLIIAALLIMVFLVHLSYIKNSFSWLDHGDIEAGRAVLPLAKLHKAFFSRFGETSFYRPTVSILNSLDAFFYGNSAWGYHLTNVLLIVAVSLASFFFVSTFFGLNFIESSIAALIVGVHPLSILPVGVISYRQELLVVAFTYVTISSYIKARLTGRAVWVVGAAIFWLLALFSKETAFFWFPALIFLWEWGKDFKRWRQQYWYILAFFLVAIIYGILRFQAVPEFWRSHAQNLSFSEALGMRLSVLVVRLLDIFNPVKPNFSDATLITDMSSWKPWLAIFAFLVGAIIVYRSKKKSTISRLLFFILIALLPALSILPLPRFSSPHYGFMAAPAAGVVIVLIGRQIMSRFGSLIKAIFVLFIGIWVSIMAINTFTAGFQFKNDLTLFGQEVARDENFREGHFYLGDYYLRQGSYKQAAKHLEAALIKNPKVIAFVDWPAAKVNLAGAYLSLQRIDKAEKLLLEVVKESSESNRLNAVYNLAVIANSRGDFQEVIKLLYKEINKWQRPEPLLLLIKAMVKTGREIEAEQILMKQLFILDNKKRQEILQSFR